MVKIFLMMMITPMILNNFIMKILFISSIVVILMTSFMNYSYMQIFTYFIMLDPMSITLVLLTFIATMLILMSTDIKSFSKKMILSIMILLLITFSVSKTIMFYIFFEMILIPTIILITSKGAQPERLQAAMYLILYTILASLPLLLSILFYKSCSDFSSSFILLKKINIPMIFILAFLAKTPMFIIHLWLPKAHVEAPLEGSMILAAILLKLGGYGLIRFLPLSLFSLKTIPHWILSISLLGAIFTSSGCIRQKDLKALIAYSSVAHMAIALSSIMIIMKTSINGAIMMMIAHGISSSALFFLVNLTYSKFHTRNIISLKSMFITNPNLTFWWFMFTMANISAPPTINLMGELLMSMSLIKWHIILSILIFLSTITTTTFCILMFLMMNHGSTMMFSSNLDPMKFFLSLIIHLIFSISIVMKMEFMTL